MTPSKKRSPRHIWLFVRAIILASVESALFTLLPYRFTARRLGYCVDIETANAALQTQTLTASQLEMAKDMRWAINAAAYWAPFNIWCVPRALTAQTLLGSKVPWIVFIGFEPNKPVFDTPAKHAWMVCGSICVTGHREAATFQPIAGYLEGPTAQSESSYRQPSE
ncbi:lasso peptide biosynthesis B2 protein [Octadecabacter dasysiphoniae]|uniref:lasso peptide biosynthesis B2 protein n=1 Tax=Octadecabacter dasysiphoniae TaxID=2909341 RepID=UPI001F2DEF93|nr:lasso peptide biosynthesis B2 protein [Octadecabacter dasysiphoniae]